MKTLTLILSLSLILSCKKEETKTPLFLDFNSGISLEEYQKIATANPDLKISAEATADYNYSLYLKSSSIKATIHPWFNTKTGGLEQLFIHGTTSKREQLEELKNMFEEKYSNPTITLENTNIKTTEKTSCLNWDDNIKTIRLCIDSIQYHSSAMVARMFKNNKTEIKAVMIYGFEIYYIDSKLKNNDLNKKTKEVI